MKVETSVPGAVVFEQLDWIRQKLVERLWRALFLLSLLLLPVLIWRIAGLLVGGTSGTLATNVVFVAIAVGILGVFPLRRRIPYAVRAAIPILILSVVGLVSFLVFGAASIAFGWLVQSNFLLSTLYSVRAGIIATAATAVVAVIVGILFMTGVLVNTVDLSAFFLLPSTWIWFVLGATVVPTVILYSIGAYQRTIGELLTTVQAKRDELATMSVQLRDALQAEERANAAKSEFLAHMTHELRTPLSGVIGLLEIADKRNQDPRLDRLLEVSHRNAEALLRIINDVLDFSKIEAGKITFDPEYFDLNDFVATSMEVFHLRAEEKDIRFSHIVDKRLKTIRYADPMRIRQVLFNLISNAMKFTSAGCVDLEVRPAFPEQPDDIHVLFVVRDTGVGIPSHAMDKLFLKFEQADTSVQKRFGGTGLGLAISKMLIDAMGGTVTVHSREGEGTTFHVLLPLSICPQERLAEVRQEPQARMRRAHAHQLNILVAEDTPTNQLVARTLLEDMGHRVSLVETGHAALAVVARESFDLVLMDLRMPELGGCDAATRIRQGGAVDRDVFICAMTANAAPRERGKARDAGMNDFMTKPVREGELHALVQRAIDFQLARGIVLGSSLQFDQVDMAQFDRLRDPHPTGPGQAGRQAALRTVFLQDVRGHQERLKRLVARSNWGEVREVAHAVCGAAAAVKLDRVSEVARQLENACVNLDAPQSSRLAGQLLGLMAGFLEENA